jgi:hypothetical protein
MERSILRFRVPENIARLEFADLPQSSELTEALEQLRIERLGELGRISVTDLRRASKAADAVTLELGCLIRRAEHGEFGKDSEEAIRKHDHESLWRILPGDVAGERIEIPATAIGLPLAAFQMPTRLRSILQRLEFKHAGDLNGKEYRHFLRVTGVGVKTVQDLRVLVQQIREGPGDAAQLLSEKRTRVSPCFTVPEVVRSVVPYDFPISARLDGVLRRMGIAQLSDLHGTAFYEMHMMLGCGRKTLKEALQLIEQALNSIGSQPT